MVFEESIVRCLASGQVRERIERIEPAAVAASGTDCTMKGSGTTNPEGSVSCATTQSLQLIAWLARRRLSVWAWKTPPIADQPDWNALGISRSQSIVYRTDGATATDARRLPPVRARRRGWLDAAAATRGARHPRRKLERRLDDGVSLRRAEMRRSAGAARIGRVRDRLSARPAGLAELAGGRSTTSARPCAGSAGIRPNSASIRTGSPSWANLPAAISRRCWAHLPR